VLSVKLVLFAAEIAVVEAKVMLEDVVAPGLETGTQQKIKPQNVNHPRLW
jgi:hypothetical protein